MCVGRVGGGGVGSDPPPKKKNFLDLENFFEFFFDFVIFRNFFGL